MEIKLKLKAIMDVLLSVIERRRYYKRKIQNFTDQLKNKILKCLIHIKLSWINQFNLIY